MVSKELQKKIDQAIHLLQSVQRGYDGQIEIAYSGGKDSDVILQLAKEAGINYRAIYKNTTIDPPGTIAHVKKMGVEIRRPKISFFQLVAKKSLPSRFSRFCCAELKEYKILDKCIIGVRKAESTKRASIYSEPTLCVYYGRAKTEANHVEEIFPILEWTNDDVRDFILDRHITLASIYYDGGVISTCRKGLAAWAALLHRRKNVSRRSRNIQKWCVAIFGLCRSFGTYIPMPLVTKNMMTSMSILLATCSIQGKVNGIESAMACLANPTSSIFLNSNSASTSPFNATNKKQPQYGKNHSDTPSRPQLPYAHQ